jgi:tryptophan halogenase
MQKIEKIIIAGNDEVALLVAASLAYNLRQVEIVLIHAVEPEERRFAESSMANIRAFLALAGINERGFIANTQATFKLGTEFLNWSDSQHTFIHSLGAYGITSGLIEFNQSALKLRMLGDTTHYDSYSVGAAAAAAGKFALEGDYRTERLPTISSGLHFNLGVFASFLLVYARGLGVNVVDEKLTNVNLAPKGEITSVVTSSGMHFSADLYIDCTGQKSLLLGDALGVKPIGWQAWLPVDRCVYRVQPNRGVFGSLTQVHSGPTYWTKKIPLRDCNVTELYYSSVQLDSATAVKFLMGITGDGDERTSGVITLQPGRRECLWKKNCLAIGEAAVTLDNFSHSSLFIAQLAVARLLDLFPSKNCSQELIDEYNRIGIQELERLRDYHALHYYLLNAVHPFSLADGKTMPEELAHKLTLFKTSGRFALYEDEIVPSNQWIALLLGLNYWPDRYNPIADTEPVENYVAIHKGLREAIKNLVSAMPAHQAYLARYVMPNKK